MLFSGWKARTNHKRRRSQSPLTLALFGMLATTSALMANLPEGRREIYSKVPEVRQCLGELTSLVFGKPTPEAEMTVAKGNGGSHR